MHEGGKGSLLHSTVLGIKMLQTSRRQTVAGPLPILTESSCPEMHPCNPSPHVHSVPLFYLIPGTKHKGLHCSTYVGKKTYNLEDRLIKRWSFLQILTEPYLVIPRCLTNWEMWSPARLD